MLMWFEWSLFKTIKKLLNSIGIDTSDWRGQSYEGARSVAGKKQGLGAHIFRINPKAMYTYCTCHRLNLAVVASCGEHLIWNLMTNI